MRRLAPAAAAVFLAAAGSTSALAAPGPGRRPEPVSLRELPLPPTAPSTAAGSCTRRINPHGTGCMAASQYGMLEGPAYMRDGRHVLLTVVFAGAPAAPDPASIYAGPQVIAIRTDGSRFPNGDAWKCLTCGAPAANAVGINRRAAERPEAELGLSGPQPVFDHPQPFPDGRRVLAGTNVLDCGAYRVTDAGCTPERLHIYPLRWNMAADGSGEGGEMRELRLNPDGAHLGWSSFLPAPKFDEYGFFGRLVFDPAPKSGTPQVARYDLENVWIMLNNSPKYGMFMPDPKRPGHLLQNRPRGVIGEFRGFTSDGRSALGIYLEESGNVDLYATDLQTGTSTRLTRDRSYTDPSKTSPDDRWLVYMNPRQSDRHLYYAGLRGIPPLADLMTLPVETCCYNNGNRRFFQPYLLRVGDTREDDPGQQLDAGPGTPGGASDPNWNGRADPAWSPDGTRVVYWQALVTAPSCGGANPLPCPRSTEPGGRRTRLMMATLTARKPVKVPAVAPVPDAVPWGIAYHPGEPLPARSHVPPGRYVLDGRVKGHAEVEIQGADAGVASVSARYTDFSNDGRHVIDGTESVERGAVPGQFVWRSDLHASGAQRGAKVTREPGGFVFGARGAISGTLTTTVDGRAYVPPKPGT